MTIGKTAIAVLSLAIITTATAANSTKQLLGFRVTKYRSIFSYSFTDDLVPQFIDGSEVVFRIVGRLNGVNKVAMTTSPSDCTALVDTTISNISRQSDEEGTTTMRMPRLVESSKKLYFCFNATGSSVWAHQGSENWAYVIVERQILSLPLIIAIIIVCVVVSVNFCGSLQGACQHINSTTPRIIHYCQEVGRDNEANAPQTCSDDLEENFKMDDTQDGRKNSDASGLLNGLVLGLMSLNLTELRVIANAGQDKEKEYGRTILSVRRTGNFLPISLVVGATILNSTTTVLIDLFVSQWATIVIVTMTIVLFCEIIPNSTVSRFALLIGAKTIYLTWIVMIITSPVSYPLGKLLDKLLGQDIPSLTRERLKELVKITANSSALKKTEIDMISGALEISAKKVEDIMTLIDDVYSIPLETLLDYETIGEIITSGYSRIPIYDGEKSNIVKIMYVRDLALIDPEDRTPLRLFVNLTAGQEIPFVEEGTTIDAVFSIFKEGLRGHMAFVVKRGRSADQAREVIGLLTLEDVIEEIIQAEIVDEHDVILDNRSRRKRQRYRMISDYLTVFANTFESKNLLISPNLRIAALSFMESELSQFSPALISPTVLQRMLRQGVIIHLPKKKHKTVNPVIFSQNQASEGFVMILEGRAQIVIGPDNLRCECGPFSYFGLGILDEVVDERRTYDYTVEAVGEVRYIKIPRELYLAAIQATNIERGAAGRVPSPYRGLLADDEEKDTSADMSTASAGKPAKAKDSSPSTSQ